MRKHIGWLGRFVPRIVWHRGTGAYLSHFVMWTPGWRRLGSFTVDRGWGIRLAFSRRHVFIGAGPFSLYLGRTDWDSYHLLLDRPLLRLTGCVRRWQYRRATRQFVNLRRRIGEADDWNPEEFDRWVRAVSRVDRAHDRALAVVNELEGGR